MGKERFAEMWSLSVSEASPGGKMDFTAIAKLRQYLTIDHSEPGSLKFKFSMAIMKDADAMQLVQSPPPMPDAVTKAKVNIFSRTLLLEYDATRIPPHLIEGLVTAKDDAEAARIASELHDALFA